MANIAIFRINYKSDFMLTLNSDAGWLTPFCIKFWTGAPSQAYFVGFDGTTYTHCAPVDGEPTKLLVQFDDHHLPIGDLKFQIGYHFTVADFPTSIEDEVINQAVVIINNDGEQQKVMLDFNGETAPEIEFSLPAYANEAQRIANESQRIANEEQRIATETQRIANEEQRISQEQTRQQNEVRRIVQEQARVTAERGRFNDYAKLKADAIAATDAANSAADLANEKAQLAADNAQLAADKAALAQSASALATERAQLATDKAALAQSAATLANEKAALAQQKAEYATAQGDYAKAQGDYAKAQAGVIPTGVTRTQTDATFVNGNHDPLFYLRQANSSLAGLMTAAGYTKLNDMPAAQEVNAGLAYDVSVLHPTSGVSGGSTYASLSAALAVIPQDKRKGGMTVKFVQSSDNNYVQYLYKKTDAATSATFTNVANWEKMNLEDEVRQLGQKVGGLYYEITKASASGTNTTPVFIPQGTTIKLHFNRSGDSYTTYYKFFNAGGTEFVNTGTTADDVELTLSDTAVGFYTYVSAGHTSQLIVTIEDDGGLQGRTEELSGDVEQVAEAAASAQSKADEVGKNIDGVSTERTFAITQGTALNTTSVANHCLINIPANTKFRAKVDYPNGTKGDRYYIYFYDGNTLKNSVSIINGDDAIFLANFKITGVAFVISAAQAIASGNVTVSAFYGTIPFELEKKADNIIESVNLFNSNDPENIIGKYINNSGSFIDHPSCFISHPIKIEPGQSLTLNNLPRGTAFFTYYDKEGHYPGANKINVTGVATLTNTGTEAVWCRFTGYIAKKDAGYYIVNNGSTSLPYQPYKDTTILRRTNILQTTGESKDDTMSQDAITKEIENVEEVTEEITAQKITDIPVKFSTEYAVTAGQALNTTGEVNRFYVDMPSGYIIRVKVNYPQGNTVNGLYFYDSEGNYVYKAYNKNDEWMEFLFDVDYASIGIFISDTNAVADGTAQVSVQSYGRLTQLEKTVERELSLKEKLRLADVLCHWMKGEKFPIGFQGDSTTDGVSTTGWTTENSHPAQDEAAGGTGKADYVCELAYPKQLQNLLRAELGGNTLRIYNIGYYGASLANNWNQLDAIYSDVYSDVKMVGIVLGINDRGGYNTPADFYEGVKDWLVKYVEYFFAKGIVPFMVTNQVVTQCGFRPLDGGSGECSSMNEDYVQTLCNKAKEEVARYYGLEVIDMNNFGRLVLESSSYPYADITEGLHFRDLGHKLEAGFLFSQLVPWVNKTDDAKEIYFGFNCAKSRTNFQVGRYKTDVNDKFKFQLNTTQASATDTLLFDAYMFNNSKNGAYNVKYLTPVASGYIVIDGDTSNPITINNTEVTLDPWDIGLHHVQVYTGESTTVAFKGFLLEQAQD